MYCIYPITLSRYVVNFDFIWNSEFGIPNSEMIIDTVISKLANFMISNFQILDFEFEFQTTKIQYQDI
jgi:hypothetical protein